MAKSAAEVGQLFLRSAQHLERGKRETLTFAAMEAKQIMNESVSRAGLPPGSSFRGQANAFRGASFNIRGKTNPVAKVGFRPLGVAVLWDQGSKAHTIVPKEMGGSAKARGNAPVGPGMFSGTLVSVTRTAGKGKLGPGLRRSKVKGQGSVTTPLGQRAYVRHPGQSGKHFGRGMNERIRKRMPELMGDSTARQIAKAGWKSLR